MNRWAPLAAIVIWLSARVRGVVSRVGGARSSVVLMLVTAIGVAALGEATAGPKPPMCAAVIPEYRWPGMVSNTVIAVSYVGIPVQLIRLSRLSLSPIVRLLGLLGAAFIVVCGTDHAIEAGGWAQLYLPAAADRALTALTAAVSFAVFLVSVLAWAELNERQAVERG